MLIARHIKKQLLSALKASPVVLLTGARQVGKSTLVKEIVAKESGARYITFDEPSVLLAAKKDPSGFLEGLADIRILVLDEVQRVPELYLPLKLSVDENRRAGRFILTGSTSALFLPELADAMVGRMAIHTLFPFSQGELEGKTEVFIDWCFSNKGLSEDHLSASVSKSEIASRMSTGGFPAVVSGAKHSNSADWFESYMQTILSRDIKDLANVDRLLEFPSLLSLLAARIGTLTNLSEISRTTSIPLNSLKRYLALLQAVFIYQPIPPWHANFGKRLVKSSKSCLLDTGLVCHLLQIENNVSHSPYYGHLLETFVINELRKQISWNNTRCHLYHWRTHEGDEVDAVLEASNGKIVALEVKAASTISAADISGLSRFAQLVGNQFHRGILLYQGQKVIPLAKNIFALPVSALWRISQPSK